MTSGDSLGRRGETGSQHEAERKDAEPHANVLQEELQTLAEGREDRTPFLLFFSVNALLLALALAIALIALVAWWLA